MRHFKIYLSLTLLILVSGVIFIYAQPRSYSNFIEHPSASLIDKGRRYIFEREMPDSALACFSLVVNRFDPKMGSEEKLRVVEAYNRLWYLYFFVYFDYTEASNCLAKAADISASEGFSQERVDLNFGCMYQLLNEQSPDTALVSLASKYLRKAFSEADSVNNEDVRQYAMANLLALKMTNPTVGNLNREWKVLSENSLDKDADIYKFNTIIYNVIEKIEHKDFTSAMSLIDSSLATLDFSGDKIRCKYQLLLLKARIYFLSRDEAKTIETMNVLEKLTNEKGLKDSRVEAYRKFSEYYSGMGNQRMAYEYKVKNLMLKDSMLNYQQLSNINELQFLEEIKDMRVELTKAQYKEKIGRYGLICLGIIILLAGIFMLILYNRNKKLNESNRSLYLKNEELLRQNTSHLACQTPVAETGSKYSGNTMNIEDKTVIYHRALEIIKTSDEIYSDEFCIARLASLTGVKEKLLSQLINELGGSNFTTLINRFRIDEACRRISDNEKYGNLTIESIGNSVGFKSRSAFIAAFKRQTGLTPSEYKKQAKSVI